MLPALLDRERYAELGRDDVAVLCDLLAERGVIPTGLKGFVIDRVETFTCGDPIAITHAIAVYRHTMTGLEFSLVPAGAFETELEVPNAPADYPPETRRRRVHVSRPFLIARTPVTQRHGDGSAFARTPRPILARTGRLTGSRSPLP